MSINMFNQTSLLNKSLDAAWMRNTVLADNIANVDTPGYKRKDVVFEDHLKRELLSNKSKNINQLSSVNPSIIVDKAHLEYRKDGNNVDIDTEMVELSKNQLRYNTLIAQVNHDFNRMKTAIT
ncbi:flagellar basal body rod protein FlgB [Natranaerovirga hydrolytica]|nr:flagellar basal body rod protein FlgB [Natranaerovirga hydrolytica]